VWPPWVIVQWPSWVTATAIRVSAIPPLAAVAPLVGGRAFTLLGETSFITMPDILQPPFGSISFREGLEESLETICHRDADNQHNSGSNDKRAARDGAGQSQSAGRVPNIVPNITR